MTTYREVMDHAELIAEVRAATDSVAEWALACARRRSALDAALAAQIAAQGKLVELEGRLLAVFPMEADRAHGDPLQAVLNDLERRASPKMGDSPTDRATRYGIMQAVNVVRAAIVESSKPTLAQAFKASLERASSAAPELQAGDRPQSTLGQQPKSI